ncbi:conserved hypothetical protein [Vibrio cholerae MO10]|uniref:Uncharacterized protein n=1 Tax=Vibrio cholerae (strain MO10) TaxID=345072 RepID=A0A0X1L0W4_VIBCO|nr:conserved hypothetical protein [Vibrio cholerae MO10]
MTFSFFVGLCCYLCVARTVAHKNHTNLMEINLHHLGTLIMCFCNLHHFLQTSLTFF